MSTAESFNLARRYSVRAENDLMQEDMAMTESPNSSPYSYKKCFAMLDKVCPDSPLPPQCQEFDDIKIALQRKNSDRAEQALAFQGMPPGQASSAMASRGRGQLNAHQIQRRMTSNKNRLW